MRARGVSLPPTQQLPVIDPRPNGPKHRPGHQFDSAWYAAQAKKYELKQTVSRALTLCLSGSGLSAFDISEIAKIVSEHASEQAIAEKIQSTGLSEEETKISLAKLLAKHDGGLISKCIRFLDIKEESIREEIALTAADSDARGVARCFQNYALTDEDRKIRVAKRVARNDGHAICLYIKDFAVNEQTREKLAVIAAEQDGVSYENDYITNLVGFSEYVQDFELSDERARIKLAGIAANKNNLHFAKHFHNYGIKDEAAIIQLAETAAARDGDHPDGALDCCGEIYVVLGFLRYIGNFSISDQPAKLRVIKCALTNNLHSNLAFFQNCGISDPAALIDIAGAIAEEGWDLTSVQRCIKTFKITEQTTIINLVRMVAAKNPELFSRSFRAENFGLTKETVSILYPEIALMSLGNAKYLELYETAQGEIIRRYPWTATICQALEKFCQNPATRHTFMACAHWLGALIAYAEISPHRANVLQALSSNQPLLASILDIRDPTFRLQYTSHFMQNIVHSAPLAATSTLPKDGPASLASACMLALFPDPEKHKNVYQQFTNLLKQRCMRRGSQPMKTTATLLLIHKEERLSLPEKQKIISLILSEPSPVKQLELFALVNALILFNEVSMLKNTTRISDIEEVLRQRLQQELHLSTDCVRQFLQLIEKFRSSLLIFTYAGKLKIGRPESLPLLGSWIQSLLDGTYSHVRYSYRKHLDAVFAGNQPGEEEWKRGSKTNTGAFLIEDTDDAETCLRAGTDVNCSCQKVDGQPSLNRCLLSIMLDGKIRLLVIHNSAGRVIARALLRVLYDPHNLRPVLFLDQTYPTYGYKEEEMQINILALARQRAQALNMPLTGNADNYKGEKDPELPSLVSYGGPVIDEYVDVLGNRHGNNVNKYTIPATKLVWL